MGVPVARRAHGVSLLWGWGGCVFRRLTCTPRRHAGDAGDAAAGRARRGRGAERARRNGARGLAGAAHQLGRALADDMSNESSPVAMQRVTWPMPRIHNAVSNSLPIGDPGAPPVWSWREGAAARGQGGAWRHSSEAQQRLTAQQCLELCMCSCERAAEG